MTDYKDLFTLDGRVKPVAGVSKAKVAHLKSLVESALRGNRAAAGTLVEAVTTSDAAFNLAHLVNVNFLPQYDEAERTWTEIAGTRPVSDFRPAVLYGMQGEWEPGVLGTGTPAHIAPVVPEATAYPESTLAGEESQSGGIQKRGFRTSFTFEAFINDAIGWLQALPGEMLQVALDTEEYEVYTALIGSVGVDQQLDAGTNPDGTQVAANSVLTREALIQAVTQLSSRTVNGRVVRYSGGFNLIVPVGQRLNAEFIINSLALTSITDGDLVFSANGYNPLSNISIIETEYVTGTQWFIMPKKGTTRRPVLERLQLIGHETPELRVQNLTGSYVGGGTVSPFEGSFDADEAAFRVRLLGRGINWSPDAILWSLGTGARIPNA